jgi:hypothetical protein
VEVFRTAADGPAIHVDLALALALALDGYRIGLTSADSTRDDHGLDPQVHGLRASVILWTDDVRSGYAELQRVGARSRSRHGGWTACSSPGSRTRTGTWRRWCRRSSTWGLGDGVAFMILVGHVAIRLTPGDSDSKATLSKRAVLTDRV